jgi:exopolyphosphatase/pppGpp-phosphohydrolase
MARPRCEEGIDVQILSARDEARLGVSAALPSLPVEDGVVADLGGSSLQLSRVRHVMIGVGGTVRTLAGIHLRAPQPRSARRDRVPGARS